MVEKIGTPGSTILIVSSADQAELVRAALDRTPASSTHALRRVPRLDAAIQQLWTEEVALLIVDLEATDLRALDELRQAAPDAPFVVICDEATAPAALERGALDYLDAGTSDRQLISRTVERALELRQVLRQLELTSRQLLAAQIRLDSLAVRDPLTAVLNRQGLQEALSREVHRARREGSHIVVLLVDLDNFRGINETLGHPVGDIVLKEVASKLKASLRPTDEVGRIGGDDFLVLLPQTRPAEGKQVADRIRLAVSGTLITVPSGTIEITASLGAVTASDSTPAIDEVLSQARLALSWSRRAARSRTPGAGGDGRDVERDELVTKLLDAIHSRQIRAVKQPIFRLSDEVAVAWELLSRPPTSEAFSNPEIFFRLCAETGLLTLADHHCLQSCLDSAAEFAPVGRCHVNLFPSTMIDVPLPHLLEAFPQGARPGSYCVEISEQQIIGDPSSLSGPVEALRGAGIGIALDDVGFGRTCLEGLVVLEPDIVKIDKRCVIGIGQDRGRWRSLERLVKVAESLGPEIVAEGIETREDLHVLRDIGVAYGQGFLWGRPA